MCHATMVEIQCRDKSLAASPLWLSQNGFQVGLSVSLR